jgi:flavodoxin
MNAVIIFWTKTGHTQRAAEDLALGLRDSGASVELVDLRHAGLPDLAGYDIIVVGSPCHAGSMKFAGTGIAKPVEAFLRGLPPGSLEGKTAAAFAVHGNLGAERTRGSIEGLLADAGARVIAPGPVVKAGVPFSLWEGPRASAEDRGKLGQFGRLLGGE